MRGEGGGGWSGWSGGVEELEHWENSLATQPGGENRLNQINRSVPVGEWAWGLRPVSNRRSRTPYTRTVGRSCCGTSGIRKTKQ